MEGWTSITTTSTCFFVSAARDVLRYNSGLVKAPTGVDSVFSRSGYIPIRSGLRTAASSPMTSRPTTGITTESGCRGGVRYSKDVT